MLEMRQSSMFSRLRGLLEVTRLVRDEADLPDLMSAIARTVSESLAFRTVAINLYRPAWDDFVVSAVHGREEAQKVLLGQVHQQASWDSLLDARFLQRGAYLVPHGEFDWAGHETYTPSDLPVSDDASAWHPEDALFVPMRGSDGGLLGILSVDEPASGRRPAGDEIDVLVAVAEHAALAVESAQECAHAERHRDALERLLEVSTRLTETWDAGDLLPLVSRAISDALGFDKVSVELLDSESGEYVTGAAVGFDNGQNVGSPLTADELDGLLRPEFEVAGCYLIPHDEARRLVPERPPGYRSVCDGHGVNAWCNHSLFVPLHDRRGLRIGYIWVDDPRDRLRPDASRLQLLRAFANQATTALTTSSHLEALREANERHRALIEAAPVAIIEFDLDGMVRRWNTGATSIFGWTADEVLGRVNPIVPEGDLPSFRSQLARVAGGEQLRDVQFRRARRDGSPIVVSVSSGPIRDASGTVVGMVALFSDISERKRADEALAASEARKDAILRSALDCLITLDADGRIVEFNPAAEETLGWTRAEATGREFLTLAVAPTHRAELAQVLESGGGALLGSRLEIAALRSDRRSFPAELALHRVDHGDTTIFTASLRDVTKSKEREERLREAEGKYRTLVEQLPLATYVNETGMPIRTRYMSPKIEVMLGYPVENWLSDGFYESVIHPHDKTRVVQEVERTHRTGEAFKLEYRMFAADGRIVWVQDETLAVRDEEYRPLFLQGFLLDVTERRSSEEALRRSEEHPGSSSSTRTT